MKRKFKMEKPKFTKPSFGKRFRAGSYSAFASVVIIAIAIIVNMMARALPTTMTQLDFTTSSIYSLSNQTKQIASSLETDVELFLLALEGQEDATITRLLDRYEGLSGHIKVSTVDPSIDPAFLNNYELNLSSLYANSVLVSCGEKYRLVSYSDIYVTDYSMDYYSYNYTTTTEFDGENALTNAILYVSSEDLPKVYTLSGHGEAELSETFTEMLKQDNMEVENLSLLSMDAVPEDASVILIHAPTSDISSDEATILNTWLDNGGRIVLMTDYMPEGEMENLRSVAGHMGLEAQNGLIIEGNNQMHVNRYPYYILPDIESHEITDALIEGGYYILTPLAQGVTSVESTEAEIRYLLTTSSSAYAKAAGYEMETTDQEEGDLTGPFNTAAASTLGEAKLVWITSAHMLDENVDYMISGANSNLVANAISWMCDQTETISIRAKSMDQATLTVTSSQNSFWSMIMIGLIPVTFIGIGITVCVRRKRR